MKSVYPGYKRCSAFAAFLAVLLVSASAAVAQRNVSGAANWKSGGVCYEVFVRSFFDSDGDGVGDLNGLIQKLDYINDGSPETQRDLGARCIWLMPVAESPSYHGYDVTNYYLVERDYGTNDDMKRLVAEAHRRGIRIVVDLVLNHASSEHPFFKDALLNADSPYRDWFIWSDTDPATVGPWGQQVWHRSPVREEYYYGIFWGGMPDLNYETEAVRAEAMNVARFWLEEIGVDGFRLDAIKHLFEDDNGRVAQHVPATHEFLREFAADLDRVAPDAFTIGEVWDSIGAMLPYYPDQLDAYFVFPAADAILEAVRTGSARALYAPFVRLQRELPGDRWSPFLRNHDQTRTLTEIGGDVAQAKIAATLLLTLPGLPFVYYGEEIGMTGNKPDPRLRTPMHWRRAPAAGFTTGLPWEPLQPDSFTANVEALENDPNSLLNLYRRLIHLRAENSALGAGELIPLDASSDAVAAFVRRDTHDAVLVITNLGEAPLTGVTVSSEGRVLTPGEYEVQSLFDGPDGAPLTVRTNGRIVGYMPVQTLAPLSSHLLALSEAGR